MLISIVNSTNRINNKTQLISDRLITLLDQNAFRSNLIKLDNFTKLFRGKYLNFKNANPDQLKELKNIQESDIVIFVVPTYHSGIPSSFKNFLDLIRERKVYQDKVIGIISSNKDGNAEGARQAKQSINAILSYEKQNSFIVPKIEKVNFNKINDTRLLRYINYCKKFI